MNKQNTGRATLAAITILALASGVAATAHADSDEDLRRGIGASARSDSDPLSVEDVVAHLRSSGYGDIREVEREYGLYEVKGRDRQGERVEVYVDARSGEIVKVERDD